MLANSVHGALEFPSVMSQRDPLGVSLTVLFCLIVFQLVSAKLLDLHYFVWLPRDEAPLTYWTVIAIETIVVCIGVWILFLTPGSRL